MKHKGYTNLQVVDERSLQNYNGFELLEVLPYQMTVNNPVERRDQYGNTYLASEIAVINTPKFLIGQPKEDALLKLQEQHKLLLEDHRRLSEDLRLAQAERDQAIKREQQAVYKQSELEDRIVKNAEEFHALREKKNNLEVDLVKLKKAIGEIQFERITKG